MDSTNPNDVTLKDVYDIVSFMKDNVVTRQEFHEGINGLRNELKGEIDSIRSVMVTKDYLDEKLYDLRGDLIVTIRKEDSKLSALVELLKQKQVITTDEVKSLMAMEPFPQA